MLRKNWWKILSVILLLLTFVEGFLGEVPRKPILHETIRNYYFHVVMWMSMMIFFIVSVINSVKYLRNKNPVHDIYAEEFAKTGIVYSLLGLTTGSVWARYTWGAFWSNDPKQLGAAIAILIYLAYVVLRNSIPDLDKRARISAVYNVFCVRDVVSHYFYHPQIGRKPPSRRNGKPSFQFAGCRPENAPGIFIDSRSRVDIIGCMDYHATYPRTFFNRKEIHS